MCKVDFRLFKDEDLIRHLRPEYISDSGSCSIAVLQYSCASVRRSLCFCIIAFALISIETKRSILFKR